VISFFVLLLIIGGFFLLSRLVGGFGNLKAIYRLFAGKRNGTRTRQSAKSSSAGSSSHTYTKRKKSSSNTSPTDEKMFADNEGTYVDFEEVKN